MRGQIGVRPSTRESARATTRPRRRLKGTLRKVGVRVQVKVDSISPPGLASYVHADILDTERWLENFTSGKHHVVCKVVFTDPCFRHQSMENALVEHGN